MGFFNNNFDANFYSNDNNNIKIKLNSFEL